jgi:hypothetical protein
MDAIFNPKAVAVIGAENMPLLQRAQISEWEKRFTNMVPWDHLKLKNRLITRKPTQNDRSTLFTNKSRALFMYFTKPEVLRSIEVDLVVYEEASLLPDKKAFEELVRRLSGKKGPVRQLILATNPEDTMGGWLYEVFKLHQLKKDYSGPIEPIIAPCNCQLCQKCLNAHKGEFLFVDESGNPCTKKGSICSNPDCVGKTKKRPVPCKKEDDCPGNQVFYRVIQSASTDNPHLRDGYLQDSMRGMDEQTASIFLRGEFMETRSNFVYKAFDDANVYREDEPLDMDKDLIWALDFNFDPQCSVVCQEHDTIDGFIVKALDEIIEWNSLPEQVAEIFCDRYKRFKETGNRVLVYGDPSGLWGTGEGLKRSNFQILNDVLTKRGFNVAIMMKRPPKEQTGKFKETVKIYVTDRVNAVNAMLKSAEDPPRIRLKINPKCMHVIKSLRELKTDDTGKGIDKRVDRSAVRRTDKSSVLLMTHPTDALGYYIAKRFPVLKNKQGQVFFQVPGESITTILRGRIETSSRENQIPEHIKVRREERRKAREARRKKKAEGVQTLLNWQVYDNISFLF